MKNPILSACHHLVRHLPVIMGGCIYLLCDVYMSTVRAHSYDFTKADGVLKSLGVRITFKPSKQTNGKANNKQDTAPAPAVSTAEQTDGSVPAVAQGADAAQGSTADVEPAAKRQKVDASATTDASFISRLSSKEENAAMHVETHLKSSEKRVSWRSVQGLSSLAPSSLFSSWLRCLL